MCQIICPPITDSLIIKPRISGSIWELWAVAMNYGQYLGVMGHSQDLWAGAGNGR